MVSLPHPYPAVEAERYLDEQKSLRGQALGTAFAIVTKGEYRFCGVVELRENRAGLLTSGAEPAS
jgi:hypothetical protein